MNPGGSPSRGDSKRGIVAEPSVDSICSATAHPFSSSASRTYAGFGMAWGRAGAQRIAGDHFDPVLTARGRVVLARLSKSAVALSPAVDWLPFIFDRPRDLVPPGGLFGMTSPVVSELISVRYFQTTFNFLKKGIAQASERQR